jgi:hypothetical protein
MAFCLDRCRGISIAAQMALSAVLVIELLRVLAVEAVHAWLHAVLIDLEE